MFPNRRPYLDKGDKNPSRDSYTHVRTTAANTETTNTTVHSATVIDEGSRTISYQTTRQTVTHKQRAGITEINTIQYSPDKAEIEKILAELNISNGDLKQMLGSSLPPLKTEITTTTRKSGSKMTSMIEEQRIKLNSMKTKNNIFESNFNDDSTARRTNPQNDFQFSPTRRVITSRFDASPLSSTSHNLISPAKEYTPLWKTTTLSTPSLRTTSSTPAMASAKSSFTPPRSSLSSSTIFKGNQNSITPPKILPTKVLGEHHGTPSRLGAVPKTTTSSSKQKSQLKPGHALIFNNENFVDGKNQSRIGTDADASALMEVFKMFHLTVEIHKDATLSKIKGVIKSIATRDFKRNSCLVIAILTHGSRNERVHARDGSYSIDDDVLFPIMKNPSLSEKPKILFIQACKGFMEVEDFHRDQAAQYGVPAEILKCYSTFEGYVSYRTEQGTFFIQKLCEELKKNGKTENIEVIMKSVTAAVKHFTGGKQIPTMTVNLTEPYIFGDYI